VSFCVPFVPLPHFPATRSNLVFNGLFKMSTLPPCPVACSLPAAKTGPLRAGISLLKLNKWKLPQSRFFWLEHDSQEVRWSKNSRLACVSYKSIPYSCIRKVSKLSKYRQSRTEHGFTIDVEGKSYVFRMETVEMRDKLVAALLASTASSENRPSLRSLLPASPPFHPIDNVSSSHFPLFQPCSERKARPCNETAYRAILTNISLAVSTRPNPALSQSPNFEDLPDTLARLIEAHKVHVERLKTDIEKEGEERSRVQSLRKRVNMLEGRTEDVDALVAENEGMKAQLALEVSKGEKLEQQLGRLGETVVPQAGEEERRAELELLRLGFVGYVCCFADEIVSQQIALSPKRPCDDVSYKKRQISCSSDLSQLLWRPISLFSTRQALICINDISSVLTGTEEPDRLQPFDGYEYLTVFTPDITVILAVEVQYEFYLSAIKHLFAWANGFPCFQKPLALLATYRKASLLHLAHLSQLQRQIKRYKSTLGDSICSTERGTAEVQRIYGEEIERLREVSERCGEGLGDCSEAYWQAEQTELRSRLAVMEALVASLSSPP